MRIIQLPYNKPNFSIVDVIKGTNQNIKIEILSPYYTEEPSNPISKKIKCTVANIYLNGVPVFLGQSCQNGANINNAANDIDGFYFLWNNATEYPYWENFGIVDSFNPDKQYTQSEINRNVVLVYTEVNIWKYFDPISNYNRQKFYEIMKYGTS